MGVIWKGTKITVRNDNVRSRVPRARFAALVASIALLTAVQAAVLPVSANSDAPVSESAYVVTGTSGTGLSLRTAPGTGHPVKAVLPEGSGVNIVSGPTVVDGEEWYEVELRGAGSVSGFSSAHFLTPQTDVHLVAGAIATEAVPLYSMSNPPAGSHMFERAIVTGYANGSDGGAVGSITASGTHTHWGTVAADRSLFPFGTRLLIEGFEDTVFVVEDTGSGVKGVIFDVWFPDVPTAVRFGTQRRNVVVLPPGS